MNDLQEIMDEFDDITGEKKPEVFATFVLDHSGSMKGDEKMCISNYNEQIQSMKSKSEINTYLTRIDFSDQIVETGPIPIQHVPEMKDYWVSGLTALNDAIAKAIELNKIMMNNSKNKDKSSLVIVITDGQENASRDYPVGNGTNELQKIIKKLQDQGDWTFTFMGAGLELQRYATESLSIERGNTMVFEKSAQGYNTMNSTTLDGLKNYYEMRVAGGTAVKNFVTDIIEKDIVENKDSWMQKLSDQYANSDALEKLKEKLEKLRNGDVDDGD